MASAAVPGAALPSSCATPAPIPEHSTTPRPDTAARPSRHGVFRPAWPGWTWCTSPSIEAGRHQRPDRCALARVIVPNVARFPSRRTAAAAPRRHLEKESARHFFPGCRDRRDLSRLRIRFLVRPARPGEDAAAGARAHQRGRSRNLLKDRRFCKAGEPGRGAAALDPGGLPTGSFRDDYADWRGSSRSRRFE